MKKTIFALLLSALVGGGVAFGVTKLTNKFSDEKSFAMASSQKNNPTDLHFTSTGTALALPDLTQAAQMGVEAVVNIEVIKKVDPRSSMGRGGMDPFEFFFGMPRGGGNAQPQEQRSGGSGVIISTDGYIVSNNHVVEGASELKITLHDGSSYTAKTIGTDPATDIALLKIDTKEPLQMLEFGNSEDLKLGEWVLAVGNPFGLTSTVTAGIISAKGRSLGMAQGGQLGIESYIQTDAAVNPGNSGGALMTTNGLLIGINTVIKSPTGSYAGYSFAVPSAIVRKVVSDIREYGLVQRAILGIAGREITQEWLDAFSKETGITERGGIYIAEVTEEGSADAAGIKKGDVLIKINDITISTFSQLQELINKHRPNDKIKVSVKRDGAVKHFDVTLRNRAGKTTLVSKDDVDLVKVLGAQFREVSEKQKKELKISRGIQVVSLNPSGLLAKSRVKAGYIITDINETPIRSVDDLNRITDKVKSIDGVYPNGQLASYATIAD